MYFETGMNRKLVNRNNQYKVFIVLPYVKQCITYTWYHKHLNQRCPTLFYMWQQWSRQKKTCYTDNNERALLPQFYNKMFETVM